MRPTEKALLPFSGYLCCGTLLSSDKGDIVHTIARSDGTNICGGRDAALCCSNVSSEVWAIASFHMCFTQRNSRASNIGTPHNSCREI